ncbi:hypothetical protein V6R21_26110 [Limibacter armeniacum]|uniref:hypothetical protein n=1 Tax=Limibacter armeniacum TaxID=466084 RepID=UPI002FE53A51
MKRFFILNLLWCYFTFSLMAQVPKEKGLQAIDINTCQGQLEFLASDWMEGREAGQKGGYMAADYLASMFKVFGLSPAGDSINGTPTYFQTFNVIEYKAAKEQAFEVIHATKTGKSTQKLTYHTDFIIDVSSIGIDVEAPWFLSDMGWTRRNTAITKKSK